MPIVFLPRQTVAALCLIIAGLALGACSMPAAPPATTATPNVPAASARPGSNDASRSDRIKTNLHYPVLREQLAPLDRAMHAYADAQKSALAERLRDAPPERQGSPGRLDLDFKVAMQTQDFVSAIAEGEADFGGAHPQPLRATFNQHLATGRILALTDLFDDADAALKALSVEARRRLAPEFEAKLRAENLPEKALAEREKILHMLLDEGTEPKAEDFAAFLVDGVDGKAIGITLVFAPAQVASYVDGPQQVSVPARIFYAQLKAEFRDAFAVDRDDVDSAGRKPSATP